VDIDNSHVRLAIIASIIFVGLSVGLSVAYYVAIVLSEQQRQADLRLDRDEVFKKELDCQNQFEKMREHSKNVVGAYYSRSYETCMIKYTDKDGEVQESKISDAVQLPPK
jgi:hypothetical protein